MKYRKGDKIFVNYPSKFPLPFKATIVAITSEVGKSVAVEPEVNIHGLHECDGFSKHKRGMWIAPHHILTQEQFEELINSTKNTQKPDPIDGNKELVISDDGYSIN